MSMPEELVEAAAERLRRSYGFSEARATDAACIALAAAFAKLPECEEMREWTAEVYMDGWHAVAPDTWEAVPQALAALAKWGQP